MTTISPAASGHLSRRVSAGSGISAPVATLCVWSNPLTASGPNGQGCDSDRIHFNTYLAHRGRDEQGIHASDGCAAGSELIDRRFRRGQSSSIMWGVPC